MKQGEPTRCQHPDSPPKSLAVSHDPRLPETPSTLKRRQGWHSRGPHSRRTVRPSETCKPSRHRRLCGGTSIKPTLRPPAVPVSSRSAGHWRLSEIAADGRNFRDGSARFPIAKSAKSLTVGTDDEVTMASFPSFRLGMRAHEASASQRADRFSALNAICDLW